MAHPAQKEFCQSVKDKFPDYFKNKSVLEVGSLNINGTVRDLFTDCKYVGIDLAPGSCVDVVCKAHEYKSDELFDVIVSCEAFEHDMYLDLTLKNIVLLLKPGGLFFFTCASGVRPEHGTIAHSRSDSPFTSKIEGWSNYYKNVSLDDIKKSIDIASVFNGYQACLARNNEDLYFWGIKK